MMSQSPERPSIPFKEFVALMALMMSLTAMSIDAVLPALPDIAHQLHAMGANQAQWVISFLFVGFTIGQCIYGPLSDSFGRKRMIYVGLLVFVTGSLFSMWAQSFEMMLLGRVLQGIGAASPRILTVAITRDQYEGEAMSKVMSYVMAIFIFVPALAPTVGQGIIAIASWRWVFALFVLMAIIVSVWLAARLPETLHPEDRKKLSITTIYQGLRIVVTNKTTLGYTICAGFVYSAMVGYLSTAQQIFQGYYHVGSLFPLYFAVSALSIGFASVVNSKIVKRFGMRPICNYALLGMMGSAALFLVVAFLNHQHVPLWGFMIYAPVNFFCLGLLFGNFNAIAMEPMGHYAGIAAAFIGSFSSLISVVFGTLIAQSYNDTLIPIVTGFFFLTLSSFLLQHWLNIADKKTVTDLK